MARVLIPWHTVEELNLYDAMRSLTPLVADGDWHATSVYVSLRRMAMLSSTLPHDDRCMPLHLGPESAEMLAEYALQQGGPWTRFAEIIYHDIAEEAENEEADEPAGRGDEPTIRQRREQLTGLY